MWVKLGFVLPLTSSLQLNPPLLLFVVGCSCATVYLMNPISILFIHNMCIIQRSREPPPHEPRKSRSRSVFHLNPSVASPSSSQSTNIPASSPSQSGAAALLRPNHEPLLTTYMLLHYCHQPPTSKPHSRILSSCPSSALDPPSTLVNTISKAPSLNSQETSHPLFIS